MISFIIITIHVWALKWLLNSSARDKLEVQCRYCFQTETKTGPAGPFTLKADEPESREDAGSLVCLCSLLLFDYWAKLFNQVWNHKKAAVLHCPRTEPLFWTVGCVFCCLGTGGRAQLCNSPVAWLLAALLPCRRTQCLVWALPRAWPTWGPWAQQRHRLFASLQHLESVWFMWEKWEASDRANVVTVSKPTLRKCSCLGNCVCVCVCVQDHWGTTELSTRFNKDENLNKFK